MTGRSMEPTLCSGDLLVVARGIRPRIGSLAVCRLPPDPAGAPRPLAVKRVTGRDPADPTRWWVERDNLREGVDSWLVGSLATADIRAVVLGRLPRLPRWSGRHG
ncbi:MAG: S26 family signal peptidase [Nostocoides sp.]